ncbi:uncharacterized protein [Taeniopygia guttata]|uniref:uncharacterized protein isoform X18 n=1 Tax=Taeniopygia guttata TaxID=59729 RepID=UPI003BB95F79
MVLLCVLLLSLLLSLLSLLSLLLSLRRRGDGRGPRLGALHLLHPQGALHLSRLARRHGPVLRLRLGGRGLSTWFGISSSFGVAPSPSSSLQTCWCRARWRPSVRRWSGTGGTGWGAPPVTWGRWCHRGAGTWHWEALALAGGGSGEQCGEHWHGLGGVLGPSFGCRVRSCVRSYVPMERLPWTPLRCSPSIPAAPSHASSLGTWWGFGWAQDGDRGLEEDPSFYGAQGFGGGPRSLWRGHPAVWGTEQFVGGWQGFGGTQEFEGTQVSKMMLGVFWGIQRELEYWTVHRCVLLQVPPPGELRAFSRCLGELLQVWGHSSVRVLDLLPLLRDCGSCCGLSSTVTPLWRPRSSGISCRLGCGQSWRGHRDPLGQGTWGACPFFRPLSVRPCVCGPLHPWRCPTAPCAIPVLGGSPWWLALSWSPICWQPNRTLTSGSTPRSSCPVLLGF